MSRPTLDPAMAALASRTAAAFRAETGARAGALCSLRKEREGDMVRAVVVAHEAEHRDVHGTPWCGTSERAKSHAERYAKRNGLTIAYSDF